MSGFMKPQVVRETFYRYEDEKGETQLVQEEWFNPDDGATEEDVEKIEDKWFCRLSAPGYMDCTDWDGPYDNQREAFNALEENHGWEPEPNIAMERIHALDVFTLSYLAAALWSSNDDSTESGGEPFDKHWDVFHIHTESFEKMVEDCKRFQAENMELLLEGTAERAGHDFWLTRNGHGAGFWDGDWPINGDALTTACKEYGEVNLYVGDDGKVHCS